jgi:hypothetical protein
MNSKRLSRWTAFTTAALAVCAFATAATASVKNPVTRPYKFSGYGVLVIHLSTELWYTEISGWGEGTHIGLFTNTGSGDYIGHKSSGTVIAANGDQINWKIDGGGYATFTGGTGRFEGVSGGHTIENVPLESTYYYLDPEHPDVPTVLVATFIYTGEGTITY